MAVRDVRGHRGGRRPRGGHSRRDAWSRGRRDERSHGRRGGRGRRDVRSRSHRDTRRGEVLAAAAAAARGGATVGTPVVADAGRRGSRGGSVYAYTAVRAAALRLAAGA